MKSDGVCCKLKWWLNTLAAWLSFRSSLDCTKCVFTVGVPFRPLELYRCNTCKILIRKKAVLVICTSVLFSSVCFRRHGDPWLNEVNKYC